MPRRSRSAARRGSGDLDATRPDRRAPREPSAPGAPWGRRWGARSRPRDRRRRPRSGGETRRPRCREWPRSSSCAAADRPRREPIARSPTRRIARRKPSANVAAESKSRSTAAKTACGSASGELDRPPSGPPRRPRGAKESVLMNLESLRSRVCRECFGTVTALERPAPLRGTLERACYFARISDRRLDARDADAHGLGRM